MMIVMLIKIYMIMGYYKLFDKNTKVTRFDSVFRSCASLKCVDIDGENSTTVKAQRPLGGGTSRWGASGVTMNNTKYGCKVQ